jgi:hypothetical protein
MKWVLVIFIYAGSFSKSDSVAVTTVEGFTSEVTCEKAGEKLNSLTKGTYKEYRYECIVKE